METIKDNFKNAQVNLDEFDSFVIFGSGGYGQIISEDIDEHCKKTGKSWVFADNNYANINSTGGGGYF